MAAYIGIDGLAKKLNTTPSADESPLHPAIGLVKTIKIGGVDTDFIIVQINQPNDVAYQGWENSVILMMANLWTDWGEQPLFSIGGTGLDEAIYYFPWDINEYLNNEFLNLIDPAISDVIIEGTFAYFSRTGASNTSPHGTLLNLPDPTISSAKIVLPSLAELNVSYKHEVPADGSAFDYFKHYGIGEYPWINLLQSTEWTRSAAYLGNLQSMNETFMYMLDGSTVSYGRGNGTGFNIRPMFAVPRDTFPETSEQPKL